MNYRTLGRTGIVVSEIGFGGWGIGGRTAGQTSYGHTEDRVSLAAVRRAFENGITLFDTSPAYGNGHSEELIGQALKDVRPKLVLATKAGYDGWDSPPDFSAAAVVASIDRSLDRFGTDYIDLLQLHNPPLDALKAPALGEALSGLVKAGKLRAWGVSAKGPQDAVEALDACDVMVVQANFNMMDVRALTSGLLDEVARRNVGFIARTPLNFGFLSGAIGHEATFPPGDHRGRWPRAQLAAWVDGAKTLLKAVGASPGEPAVQAALRFCLSFPSVSSIIPGISTPAEADQNAAASQLGALSPEAVAAVLEINRRQSFYVSETPRS